VLPLEIKLLLLEGRQTRLCLLRTHLLEEEEDVDVVVVDEEKDAADEEKGADEDEEDGVLVTGEEEADVADAMPTGTTRMLPLQLQLQHQGRMTVTTRTRKRPTPTRAAAVVEEEAAGVATVTRTTTTLAATLVTQVVVVEEDALVTIPFTKREAAVEDTVQVTPTQTQTTNPGVKISPPILETNSQRRSLRAACLSPMSRIQWERHCCPLRTTCIPWRITTLMLR
jgi:hypothetical protein